MPSKVKAVLARYDKLGRLTDDEKLNDGFRLAHSIYRFREADRHIALTILQEALVGVAARLTAQDEADRHDPQRPTKVRWNSAQWLQLLIYCKSERYEKQQEDRSVISIDEKDMIIRYIKHLILTTCRRNSFHVSLGLSRLLYNYSASETMTIYDLIFQDPDNSTKKADAYYRARKNKLIEELGKRFRRFVTIYQGLRGEKKFQTHDDSGRFAELAASYLRLFTPWETSCELPERFDAWTSIPALQSSQRNQIHAVIDPKCFSRITEARRLDRPDRRLAVPVFSLTKGQGGGGAPSSPDGDSPSARLTGEEANEIRSKLAGEKRRRKKFFPRSVSILLDGTECARLDLERSNRIKLELEDDAALIELVGHNENEELLLAAHILIYEDGPSGEESDSYSVVLEGGQKISLDLLLTRDDSGDVVKVSVEITYQKICQATNSVLRWQEFKDWMFGARGLKREREWLASAPAVALACVILTSAGFFILRALRSEPTGSRQVARQQALPLSTDEQVSEQKAAAPGVDLSPQTRPSPERASPSPPSTPLPSTGRGVRGSPAKKKSEPGAPTRDTSANAVRSLANVKRVYVAPLGDDAFSLSVRQNLRDSLRASGRFVVTESPDEADTALMGYGRQGSAPGNGGTGMDVGQVAAELLNVPGEVIWPERKYRGTAQQIAIQLTEDLISDIQREVRRQKK